MDKDERLGCEYAQRSARQNNPLGLYVLGMCYFNGHSVHEDKFRAFQLIEKAAALGQTDALERLGLCYRWGTGVPADELKV